MADAFKRKALAATTVEPVHVHRHDSLLGQYETASGKPFTVEVGDHGILWKRTPGGQEEQTDEEKLKRELADGKIRRAEFVELK